MEGCKAAYRAKAGLTVEEALRRCTASDRSPAGGLESGDIVCSPPDVYPQDDNSDVFPQDANLGVGGGVFWGCFGGVLGGVPGVFWGCSGGILGESPQNTTRTDSEHPQNTPGTPPRTPPKHRQNPPPTPKLASWGNTSELASRGYISGWLRPTPAQTALLALRSGHGSARMSF